MWRTSISSEAASSSARREARPRPELASGLAPSAPAWTRRHPPACAPASARGSRVHATYEPGPGDAGAQRPLLHGREPMGPFTGCQAKVLSIVELLCSVAGLCFDWRGDRRSRPTQARSGGGSGRGAAADPRRRRGHAGGPRPRHRARALHRRPAGRRAAGPQPRLRDGRLRARPAGRPPSVLAFNDGGRRDPRRPTSARPTRGSASPTSRACRSPSGRSRSPSPLGPDAVLEQVQSAVRRDAEGDRP